MAKLSYLLASKDAMSQSYFILLHSFAQLHPLLFLLYSVVTKFSKWQHVCENLSYKNELWILFQILSPCSTVKLLIIVEIFISDLNFQKISIISEFSFFCNDHNDSCLSNLLLKAIFQIFTSTMPNFVVLWCTKTWV